MNALILHVLPLGRVGPPGNTGLTGEKGIDKI